MAEELPLAETAAELLAADDTVYAVEPVPEWGRSVRLRSLTSTEWALFQASFLMVGKDGKVSRNMEAVKAARGKIVALCAVTAQGKRLFSDDHAGALAAKHSGVMERLCNRVLAISGVGDDAREEARGN